jgi:hypothetical protein
MKHFANIHHLKMQKILGMAVYECHFYKPMGSLYITSFYIINASLHFIQVKEKAPHL